MKYILIDDLPIGYKTIKDGDLQEGDISHEEEMRRRYYNHYRQEALEKAREITEDDIINLVKENITFNTYADDEIEYINEKDLAKAILQKLEGGEDGASKS